MTKFNNLKGKRVKSNLKHTESKLVKKRTTLKGRNTKKATIIEVSRVMPFCVLPLCILHFCVLPLCVMPFWVLALCVMPFCVLALCVMPLCVLPFSVMSFSA